MYSIFGMFYIFEQLFSQKKNRKSKSRSPLKDNDLEDTSAIANTQTFPYKENLVNNLVTNNIKFLIKLKISILLLVQYYNFYCFYNLALY